MGLKSIALALLLLFPLSYGAKCPVETNIVTRNGGKAQEAVFENRVGRALKLYWIAEDGFERQIGDLEPFSELRTNSFVDHAFRVRTDDGFLVKQHVVRSGDRRVLVNSCDGLSEEEIPLWDEGRDAEFESLRFDHSKPCAPADDSSKWTCVVITPREEISKRNMSLYGFQEGEVPARRVHQTYDTTYTSQISRIPKVTPSGPGFQIMNQSAGLRKLLSEFYEAERGRSMGPHGTIAGGYTNNDIVPMDKINLDHFPAIHQGVIREVQQILQWWTRLRLKHTSTFGIRVYRRNSMLIDHVDRMDTHVASAVIQVFQDVDHNGGWPLEVLLPDGAVGEVYLQPGQMVLYEGAWLRHGRPMRLRGNEFSSIFSHFAPLDWRGPNDPTSPSFYGYPKGRCSTMADEDPAARCVVSGKYAENEVDLFAPEEPSVHDEL